MVRCAFILSLVMLLASCDILGSNNWSWHQKLTVSVQTPAGIVADSSVMLGRMKDTRGAFVPAEAVGVSFGLRGEAVVMKLPNGRYLFALLKGVPSASWLFFPKVPAREAGEQLEKTDGSNSRQLELPIDQYPLLVTFGDMNDPSSVKKVEPHNLAAAFGPGYRLNSITMRVTDEPLTEGKVMALLPWLNQYYNKRFDGQRFGTIETSIPFANSLAAGAFDTEKK